MENKVYTLTKTKNGITEYFAGFANAVAQWSINQSDAVTWDNRLHAEAQAQLLRHPVSELREILGEALSRA